MFPYTGTLSSAINGNAYTMQQIDRILDDAKANGLDVIPVFLSLVYCFNFSPFAVGADIRSSRVDPQIGAVCASARGSAVSPGLPSDRPARSCGSR